MKYSGIKYPDVANGDGCRVSLFVSGCRLNCDGCFNSIEQDFDYGTEYTEETKQDILEKLEFSWIQGLSLLGGDPLEAEHQKYIADLVVSVRELLPTKDIWLWTGRIYPRLPQTEYTQTILKNIDILIDGPYIHRLKTEYGKYWYGSSNQRILKMKNGIVEEVLNESY